MPEYEGNQVMHMCSKLLATNQIKCSSMANTNICAYQSINDTIILLSAFAARIYQCGNGILTCDNGSLA
jgi:hypothetical protein